MKTNTTIGKDQIKSTIRSLADVKASLMKDIDERLEGLFEMHFGEAPFVCETGTFENDPFEIRPAGHLEGKPASLALCAMPADGYGDGLSCEVSYRNLVDWSIQVYGDSDPKGLSKAFLELIAELQRGVKTLGE